jgi:hypothetical protein
MSEQRRIESGKHMNTELARLANNAAQIETSGRWHAVKARVKFLAHNPGSGNGWWVQLFGGLCCQTFSEYLALKRTYEKKENGDAALLAWRARNLLELSVWATYCVTARENARRLFQRASCDGMESLEGPYDVSATAAECGIGEQFSVSYRMLSKFAHPSVMQIVAAPDDAREVLQRDVLYGQGCLFFCDAFDTLERQLLATGDVAQADWRSDARCGDEAELTADGQDLIFSGGCGDQSRYQFHLPVRSSYLE